MNFVTTSKFYIILTIFLPVLRSSSLVNSSLSSFRISFPCLGLGDLYHHFLDLLCMHSLIYFLICNLVMAKAGQSQRSLSGQSCAVSFSSRPFFLEPMQKFFLFRTLMQSQTCLESTLIELIVLSIAGLSEKIATLLPDSLHLSTSLVMNCYRPYI